MEESSVTASGPVLKRKLNENETLQVEIPEEYLESQSLEPQSSMHSTSPPRFDELNEETSLFQLSKRIKVEDTQCKCDKIIEQLKDNFIF